MAMDNEKKKMLVLGVLGTALLGVGAFQLIPKGAPAPSASSSKPKPTMVAAKGEDPGAASNDPLLDLVPRRDPFTPLALPVGDGKREEPTQPTPPPSNPPAQRTAASVRQFRPQVPPLSPLPGALPGGPISADGVNIVPNGKPARRPGEFAYHVVGVVVGDRPVVVLQGDDGSQRMISLGGGVDGDSRVVAIEEGRVTVQHRGKRLTLPVGGNSNAK